MSGCVYLKDPIPDEAVNGNPVHRCTVHGRCITVPYPAAGPPVVTTCSTCKEKLPLEHPKFAEMFCDSLIVVDRDGRRSESLRGMLAGGAAFLVAGGPSAKQLPLEKLTQRGIFSMAVNNMAGYARTNAFVCSDPPLKFHHGIWLDPTIMKFAPSVKFHRKRNKLKQKVGNEFKPLKIGDRDISMADCPNVWGFGRRVWMQPDESFFIDDDAAWGNQNAGVTRTGQPKTVCTMLLAMRILYHLGARTIYLVGVDFFMDPKAGELDNYAFGQKREPGTCESNNAQYRIVNMWLTKMRYNGVFERFGLEVFNCCEASGLTAFDHAPFDLAINDALKNFPAEPFDLEGWYEKK